MLSLVLGACGGDSGHTGTYTAGIDGTRTLSTLTDTEKTKICLSGITYYSTSVTPADACQVLAIGTTRGFSSDGPMADAEVRSFCSNIEATCLSATTVSRDFDKMMCAKKMDCPGTVAEYETCVSDLRKGLVLAMVGFPHCQALTVADYQSVEDPSTSLLGTNKPASCQALDEACSGLIQAVMTNVGPLGR